MFCKFCMLCFCMRWRFHEVLFNLTASKHQNQPRIWMIWKARVRPQLTFQRPSSKLYKCPDEGLPCVNDWITCCISFVFNGSGLAREPFNLNLPSHCVQCAPGNIFEVKKGFTRLSLVWDSRFMNGNFSLNHILFLSTDILALLKQILRGLVRCCCSSMPETLTPLLVRTDWNVLENNKSNENNENKESNENKNNEINESNENENKENKENNENDENNTYLIGFYQDLILPLLPAIKRMFDIPCNISTSQDHESVSFEAIQLSTQGAERQRKDVTWWTNVFFWP